MNGNTRDGVVLIAGGLGIALAWWYGLFGHVISDAVAIVRGQPVPGAPAPVAADASSGGLAPLPALSWGSA